MKQQVTISLQVKTQTQREMEGRREKRGGQRVPTKQREIVDGCWYYMFGVAWDESPACNFGLVILNKERCAERPILSSKHVCGEKEQIPFLQDWVGQHR